MPTRVRRIVWSVVCACAVFAGFVAYAFLAPTIYQTAAEVRLEIPAGLENALHPIADRRHRLTKAVLGPDALKQLSHELALTKPDQRLELAHQLSTGVAITTDDGQLFRIVCTNPSAERALHLCQGLARMAAARLPEAAMLRDSPEDQARREKLEQLLTFLTQHPELSSAQGQGTSTGKASDQPAQNDALLNALQQQRRVVIGELNELQRVDPKNPYADGLKQEIDQAHKRLAAIDAAIASRRKGLETKEAPNAGAQLDSKVMARLTEQLNQLAAEDPKPGPKPSLKASVTEPASLPSSPIVPDRTRLLILGALASLGVAILGLGFAFAARNEPAGPVPPTPPFSEPPIAPQRGSAFESSAPGPLPIVVHGSAINAAPADAGVNGGYDYGTAAPAATVQAPSPEHVPLALPAPQQPSEPPNADRTSEVIEPLRPVKLTTTQVMEDAVPAPRPEPEQVPRTQVGGFEVSAAQTADAAAAPSPQEKPAERSQSNPDRSDQPISAKTVVALGAKLDRDSEPEESAPQTLLGGSQAPPNPEPTAPQPKPAYTPPKRNITRRLGSLSWVDQAELSRSPTQPVSTRYSYVSSRPPPPDSGQEARFDAQAAEVIDVPAEGDEPGDALSVRVPTPLVHRNPVPAGWSLPAELMPFSTPELATTVSEGWRSGCIIVGVTSRFDLSRIKASVAASLAFRSGDFVPRVLLMEGDFQDPKVHRTVRVEMPISGGLSQQLQVRLAQGARGRVVGADHAWEVMECHASVDVLAEGFIRSPGGILSQQYEECLNDLRNCYDLVIIDGPPTGTGSEAQAFADLVDGVVVCTPRDRPDVQGLADGLFRNQRFIVPFPLRV